MRALRVCSLLTAVLVPALVAPALLVVPVHAGVPSKKAVYRGGTLPIEEAAGGHISTLDPVEMSFRHEQGELIVRYEDVNSLEYGQKAGRRLGLAVVVSPVFLLSKKRKHYLTISYLDRDGRQQAAVFELGKKIVRTTLAGLAARTGRRIEYQDEEARQAAAR